MGGGDAEGSGVLEPRSTNLKIRNDRWRSSCLGYLVSGSVEREMREGLPKDATRRLSVYRPSILRQPRGD